jgi:hypothetical protein
MRSPDCAIARSSRSACRSACGEPRSPRSEPAICIRTAPTTHCASHARADVASRLLLIPRPPRDCAPISRPLNTGLTSTGAIPAAQAQRQAPGGAPAHRPDGIDRVVRR